MTIATYWLIARILIVIVSIALIIRTIHYIIKMGYLEERRKFGLSSSLNYEKADKKSFNRKWSEILRIVRENKEDKFKDAVKSADNLLAEILRHIGYKGINMNQILLNVGEENVKGIDDFKNERREVFNKIDDEEFELDLSELKKVLRLYQEIFRELRVI